jgi:hypothetical protein
MNIEQLCQYRDNLVELLKSREAYRCDNVEGFDTKEYRCRMSQYEVKAMQAEVDALRKHIHRLHAKQARARANARAQASRGVRIVAVDGYYVPLNYTKGERRLSDPDAYARPRGLMPHRSPTQLHRKP